MRTLHQKGSPPVERCLACEAEEGSPPAAPLSIATPKQAITERIAVDRCTLLGVLARQALIAEAELTPKPGLVDRRGSGAHTDLSLPMMRRSARAIEPFIRHMAFQSQSEPPSAGLRAALAATGRAAEIAMLRVTNGANTHKGAIWTLGLLAAAAAGRDELPLIRRRDEVARKLNANDIARIAGLIASFKDSCESAPNAAASAGRTPNAERQTPNVPLSHGQLVAQKFGVSGARGEAINGFPHIVELGLPMLRTRRRARVPEPIARLDALLAIMAELDDTCLLHRGGKEALQAAKERAATVLVAGGAGSAQGRKHLFTLDSRLLELGVSPGGSADLLAGTLFLDAVERRQTEIRPTEVDQRDLTPITFHQSRLPILAP